jgi:hypothetical protein
MRREDVSKCRDSVSGVVAVLRGQRGSFYTRTQAANRALPADFDAAADSGCGLCVGVERGAQDRPGAPGDAVAAGDERDLLRGVIGVAVSA